MASLSSTLHFFSPKNPLPFFNPLSIPQLSSFILTFSSPISFQLFSNPSPSSPRRPIKAQPPTAAAAAAAALPSNLRPIIALFQSISSELSQRLRLSQLMQKNVMEIGGLEFSNQDEILTPEMDALGGENGGSEGNLESNENRDGNLNLSSQDGIFDQTSGGNGGVSGGRKERMRGRLERELNPVELEIEDVSHMHAGHAGVRGYSGGETHFNVKVVSKEFEGKSLVKRHRIVYDLLREELESGLHALSIVAKTPSEV